MIILGIDPGTNRIGYGVLSFENGKPVYLDCGCIELNSSQSENYSNLNELYDKVSKLIKKWKVEIMSIERLFFFKNAKTVMQVSEARGVILLAAAQARVIIKEFTPLQAKQAIASDGRADKKQVQKMVRLVLNLDFDPKPDDAADALALAICCAHSMDFTRSRDS
mgnify:CR=1 FL=1